MSTEPVRSTRSELAALGSHDEDQMDEIEEPNLPPPRSRVQRWVEANRAKIWIWGIGALALSGVGCMFLIVILLIFNR